MICGHGSARQRLVQVFVNLFEKAHGGQPPLIRADKQRQIFGHITALDRFDDHPFQRFGKAQQGGIAVQFGAMLEPAGPSVDRGD